MKIKITYVPLEGDVSDMDLELKEGVTAKEALTLSGILKKYPEIDLEKCKVGVYSQPKPHDYVLQDNDRLEIYRLLDAAQRKFAKERLK